MKIFFIKTPLISSVILLFFMSCTKPTLATEDDLNKENANLTEVEAVIQMVNFDSVNDFNKFKVSIKFKLAENQKVLNNLKLDNDSNDRAIRSLENSEINKLEKRNMILKHKVENYKQSSVEHFVIFKEDVTNQLDDLRISISCMAEYDK